MPEIIFSYAFVIVAFCFSVLALIISCITISVVIGFKNSTHTIEWKPLAENKIEDDPFAEEPLPFENPNKRKIKNPFPQEVPKEEEPFADLDDPNLTSNNW